MNTRIFFRLLLALLLSPLAAQASEPLTLAHALELAASDNPGLAQAGARARALAEAPQQVSALPDPVLSLNALNLPVDTFSRSQEAMTQTQVGLGFTLPYPGKLVLREQAARLEADAAAAGADETRLLLLRNVSMSWWNLFYLDNALGIVRRNQSLLRQFIQIAEAKYRTGQGMQSDVLLAQVELSKLLEAEIGLNAARSGQAATMNALLGRSADETVTLPPQADEILPAAPEFAALRENALQARPALAAQRSQVEAARAREALAEKDYYPDFKLGAAYGFRDGLNPNGSRRTDMASLTFSMNLPLFTRDRQDHALAQRRADVQQQQYGLQDRIAQMDGEIGQALADYRAGREQASLLKSGILPQSEQTAAAMLAAYQVDKVDFLNLIRAQITLYNYQTQYWKTLASANQAWARLEAAVGRPLAQHAAQAGKENDHE